MGFWEFNQDTLKNESGRAISHNKPTNGGAFYVHPQHRAPSVSEDGKLQCIITDNKPAELSFFTPHNENVMRKGQTQLGKMYTYRLKFEPIHECDAGHKLTFFRLWGPGYHKEGVWQPLVDLQLDGRLVLCRTYFGNMMGSGAVSLNHIGTYEDRPLGVTVDYLPHANRGAIRLCVEGQEHLSKSSRASKTILDKSPQGPLTFIGASGASRRGGNRGISYSSVEIGLG